MSALRVLFIGGTGIISSACADLAIQRGIELSVLNRATTTKRTLTAGAELIQADIRDAAATRAALGDRTFDVVVDFVAYTPDHVQGDIDLFTGRTRQYVFISSASAYQKPVGRLPIVESTPLVNPYWEYSRDKIACEDLLLKAYRETGFPMTIVRPSHTYDQTAIPLLLGGWTAIDRMRRGEQVVVHGDGTSLWTLTHHADFAHAFVGLLGHPQAIGDSFHITSDEALTWNQIYTLMAEAAGTRPRLGHVSSESIAAVEPKWGPPLLGDMSHSVVFDNSKVKAIVPDYVAATPFATGARQIVDWYDADPTRGVVDDAVNSTLDKLIASA